MSDAGQAYLKWYYETNVWKDLHYRGVCTLKLPLDMWNYQEILFEKNIHWVVETGTRHGGSVLFLRICSLRDSAKGSSRALTSRTKP